MAEAFETQWPAYDELDPETLPTLEVSLEPPPVYSQSHKEWQSKFDSKRDNLEKSSMKKIKSVYEKAQKGATSCIENTVGRALQAISASGGGGMALMQTSIKQDPSRFPRISGKIHVHIPESVGPSQLQDLSTLEKVRQESEQKMFEEATTSMEGVPNIVCAALEAALHTEIEAFVGNSPATASSFLQSDTVSNGLPMQAVIKSVAPKVPFPTTLSLAQGLQNRRLITENLAAWKTMQMHLRLIKDVEAVINKELEKLAGKIRSEHSASSATL